MGLARLAGISACQVIAQAYQTQRMETLCDGFRNTCFVFCNCARFLLAPATVDVALFASRALHRVMLGRPVLKNTPTYRLGDLIFRSTHEAGLREHV